MVTTTWRRTRLAAVTLRRGERGATAVEYTLMAGFIAAVIVTSAGLLGAEVLRLFVIGLGLFS
jgi:Flp pilus assembly pilin Flp